MPFARFPEVMEKARRYPLRFVESTDVTHNESASNSIPWTWFVGPFRVTVRTNFHSPDKTDCGSASTTKMLERPGPRGTNPCSSDTCHENRAGDTATAKNNRFTLPSLHL